MDDSKLSFLEAFARRLGSGASGGRGVEPDRTYRLGVGNAPGRLVPTADRGPRVVVAPTRRAGSCNCYGHRTVPGVRRAR